METGYIYMITNKINEKKYIGQTINFQRRCRQHINKSNIAIGKAIEKYGEQMFSFEIIEECCLDNLDEREIYWIDKYNTYNGYGYNCHVGGNAQNGKHNPMYGMSGEDNPFYGKNHTKETRKQMKKNHADMSGKNNPWYGHEYKEGEHPSITTNKKMSLKIIKDKYEQNLTLKELKNKYDLAMSTLSGIINGRHWTTQDIVRDEFLNNNHQGTNNMSPKVKSKLSENHADFSGNNHPQSKLNKKDGLDIIKKYKNSNITQKELAEEYNVHPCTISEVTNKRHWTTKSLNV